MFVDMSGRHRLQTGVEEVNVCAAPGCGWRQACWRWKDGTCSERKPGCGVRSPSDKPCGILCQTLLRGSGFQNGKERIYEFYQNITDKKERVSAIRKEYGQGGAGWPLEGYGLHGYDTFHGKGLRLQWRDEEGEKEGYVSWTTIEAEIGALILTGDYYQPVIKEDIEPDYEEEDEVIDAEYWEILEEEHELTDDEIEEILEEDRRRADERYESEHPEEYPAENYHMDSFTETHAGPKARFDWNITAIKTLKKVEREHRPATVKEQDILARYVGWGGLPQAFDTDNESWKQEYAQLKELLTDAEYRAARETVTDAFYTPPEIAGAMYQALSQFGFTKGNILEPSMGIGNFFGSMPKEMERNCQLYGVEKDDISGRIARLLYPKYTNSYMLIQLLRSEPLEPRLENGKRLHYNFQLAWELL